MKRFISLLFVLLLTLGAISCAGGDVPAETTAAVIETLPETEAPTPPIALLNDAGEAVYAIIRPDECSGDEKQTSIDLKKSLKTLTGAEFSLSSDFLMPNQTLEGLAEVPEILIGATNRPESIAAREGLTVNDYVIRVIGSKIVIAGGCDLMTKRAIEEFLSMLGAENGFTLSADTDVRGKIERGPYIVALTNQGKEYLEVYDISSGKLDESSLVWSYKLPYYNIAGTKLRHSEAHGDVALAVCGSTYGCMISYPEGKLLWSTEAAANNPHSIELMPNGVIAIASSTGGEVRFFTTDKKTSRTPAAKVTLEDAHGVLWDDEKQVLWAIGRTVLTAYRVTLDGTKVTVTEETSLRATIPSDWSHDLAPVYGNTDTLWISTGSHVYRYNKETKTFSTDYEGHTLLDRSDIKGIGNFDDGSVACIHPDGAYKSWTSQSAFFLKAGNSSLQTLTSADGHFYKIRVWDARYQ
jgi:hypothetical protein